ncbi:hypothetical protein [Streptomyces sp. NPDC051286]|uniref:hypothetical protein n=1 Tax=Streptomyces sp. NPDC051286 TaxID=3365647 RepID=UPI00379F1BF9
MNTPARRSSCPTHSEQAEAFAVSDRPATVAEEFDQRQGVHLVRLRLLGTCLRMLDAEIAAGNPTPAIRTQHALLTRHFDRWVAEVKAETADMRLEIRKPIAVQLAAILLAAQTARNAG